MNSLLRTLHSDLNVNDFLISFPAKDVSEIRKESADTRAWFITVGEQNR